MTCRCLAINGPTAMVTTTAITPTGRLVTNALTQQHRLRSMFMAALTMTQMAMRTPLMDARMVRAVLGLVASVVWTTTKMAGRITMQRTLAVMSLSSIGSRPRIQTVTAMATTPVQIVAQPLLTQTVQQVICSRSTLYNTPIMMATAGAITTATL